MTFRSWNGKAYRMNSDMEIAFFPDHTADLLDWGFTLTQYTGTYHVDPDGLLTVSLTDYQPQWPQTMLELDGDVLLLRPIEPEAGFVAGAERQVSRTSDNGFWPFRMLTGNDEQQVLRAMKHEAKRNP